MGKVRLAPGVTGLVVTLQRLRGLEAGDAQGADEALLGPGPRPAIDILSAIIVTAATQAADGGVRHGLGGLVRDVLQKIHLGLSQDKLGSLIALRSIVFKDSLYGSTISISNHVFCILMYNSSSVLYPLTTAVLCYLQFLWERDIKNSLNVL